MSGEWDDGKDHSATSQLCEIVLPQPGNPLLGLADCYSRSSSRVYSEAAVNKCFSSKTHINKPSANTLPSNNCTLSNGMWALKSYSFSEASSAALPVPFQLHFVNWNRFRLPQGKPELTQGQRLLLAHRTMAILTAGRKYLQALGI